MLSIIIPLYKSEENLPRLFAELTRISSLSPVAIEAVFVDDGGPDNCGDIVASRMAQLPFRTQLLRLSRNFGAFAAISAGLQSASGDYFAAIAADLQEPPELVLEFYEKMRTGEADVVFGVRGQAGNVIVCASPFGGVTDGTGGAYHYGCSFGPGQSGGSDWYEDVATGNPDLTFGLVMAEVCESYMGLQGKGWNCGGSGGEGLSRFLAEIVSGGPNGALSAFSSGSSWDGTDWISRDQGTDQDYPSIGCAILYCWWMTKLGFTPAEIVQAGEPDGTLASNYAALTGKPKGQAFADFSRAVGIVGHASDNPWNAPTPPYPPIGPPPPPPPPPVSQPEASFKLARPASLILLRLRSPLPAGQHDIYLHGAREAPVEAEIL